MQPNRKQNYDIEPDIRPRFGVVNGGGESTPERGNLQAIDGTSDLGDQERSFGVIDGGGESTPSRGDLRAVDPNENINDTKGKEVAAGSWTSNYIPRGTPQKISLKTPFKRKGPLLTMISLALVGAGIGINSLLLMSLPVHVMENVVKKYDTQNTSFTIRANKVIASKISQSATSGSCNVVKIACRFSTPSNTLLKNFEKNGIKALDKNGAVITSNGLFPNTRPTEYTFTDSTGKELRIPASEFSNKLASNDGLRAAFHSAYNPRYVTFADSVFKAIQSRWGFSKKNTLAGSGDEAEAKKTINETVKGTDTNAKAAAAEGAEATDDALKKLITDEANKSVTKVAKAGRGNAVGLIAGATCLVGDVPGIITKTERAYQMAQVIKYSAVFLSAFSAIKAGDAKPEQTGLVGKLLTKVVNNKSAMDSFGMKYSLFGDTKPANNNYKKFVPGGNTMSTLGGIAQFTSSEVKVQACAVATNPLTGLAIDAATSETVIIPLINVAVGLAVSKAMETALPPLITAVVGAIPPEAINQVLGFFIGDLTQNLEGESVGDAFISGASNMMSQTANAGGNMPLTIDQAIAYNNTAKDVSIAYAKEDRATLSPLDPNSPNTVVGSMVGQFLPYTRQIGSIAGTISAIGSITTNSLRSIIPGASAAPVSEDDYTLCPDPAIKSSHIAAGPNCDIVNGIPPKYLNMNPKTIIDGLTQSGDIDEDTGEPKEGSGLQAWGDLCKDGATDQLAACNITNDTTGMYAVYTVDHRVQKTMDNQDTVDASETANTPSSTTPANGSTTGAAVKGDDYPYGKGPIDIASPLGYYTRECVDFVAWRLNVQSGITSAPFKFSGYGNAETWRGTALANGFTVDKKPTLGSVAWWAPFATALVTAGSVGHVAIVSGVNPDGSIVIEQYNGSTPGHTYSSMTIPASAVNNLDYLHIADIKGGQ